MSEGFIFYQSFADALEALPAEDYKECVSALCKYAINGEEPETDNPFVKMFFTLARPQVDANNKRREAGKNGGVAKASKNREEDGTAVANSSTAVANASNPVANPSNPVANPSKDVASAYQSVAKVKVKEKVKVKDKDIPPISPLTVCGMSADDLETLGVVRKVAEKLSEWITSRLEQGDPITETGLKSLASIAKDKISKHGADAVAQLITECMASGYKGIVWDRLEKARSGTPKKAWQPEERTSAYGDMNEFEKRLLAN